MATTRERLLDAGWAIACRRFIDLQTDDSGAIGERSCTWHASKGVEEVVVKGKLGDEQTALRYLYDVAKTIDPDLQQIAMEAGSGGWVFDLSQVESELNREKS